MKHRLTPAEITDHLRGSTRIVPGVWADRDGGLHFSGPELLELFGWDDTPENREQVLQIVRQVVRAQYPGVRVIEQD